MCAHIFFALTALLYWCSGGASENSEPEKILAFVGETVTLPCNISVRDSIPAVEWSKEGLNSSESIVFVYRDGCETHEMKNLAFQYRTNLFMNKLINGNISLRISEVQLSDTGKYICKTIQSLPEEVVTRELVVVAVSEPKLSVVPAVDGGVTLQCEANCWFPEPELTFLDEQGNNISAEDPKSNLDSSGCFTVTRRITVQTASNRVTCRVTSHQPDINLKKVTDIFIPDNCLKSCTPTIIIIIIIIAVLVLLILCALIAFLYKKCGNSVGKQKLMLSQQSSDKSTTHSNADVYPQRNQADDDGNVTTEHQRTIDDLMLGLHDRDEIICRLTEELKDLRSKQSPVVCQYGQPTFDNSPSKSSLDVSEPINLPAHQFVHDNSAKPAASTNSNRLRPGHSPQKKDSKPGASMQFPAPGPLIQASSYNNSSPALSTDNGAVSPSSSSPLPWQVVRSMSLSRPRQNGARPQRRNTVAAMSNRFSVLGSLSEDSEPLMQ